MSQITLSEKEVRIQKTHKMKKMGIHPYAQSFQKKDLISDIIAQYEGEEDKLILKKATAILMSLERQNTKPSRH